jgi:hypothetical protein
MLFLDSAFNRIRVLVYLRKANIAFRIIGIGNAKAAHMFSLYTKPNLECFRVDSTARVYSSLCLHRGPTRDAPSWIPPEVLEWFSRDVCGNDKIEIFRERLRPGGNV